MAIDSNNDGDGQFLWGGRLVPAGREGNTVYARTLRPGEEDSGEAVHIGPGEQLIIRAGGLTIDSREIDALSVKGHGGYAPVANTVWTWYRIVGEEPTFLLFFTSMARRIDAAHALWASAMEELQRVKEEGAIPRRTTSFRALGTAEMAIIALHRGTVMVQSLVDRYCTDLKAPDSLNKIRAAVHEMRLAFEHIDERAEGKVGMSGKTDPSAWTIFDQPDFLESSVLRYKEHSLNFETDVISALLDCRELIMEAIDSRAKSHNDRMNQQQTT